MDDEKRPRDQRFDFYGPTEHVAGRDIHIHRVDKEPLDEQRWERKHYLFGRLITSGWLSVITFLGFFCVSIGIFLKNCSHWKGISAGTHSAPSIWPIFGLMIPGVLVAVLVSGVHRTGFTGITRTLYGFAKDLNGYIFLGKLGGKGSFCSVCHAKLAFHNVPGTGAILSCTRNSTHAWPFDFTRVVN